MFGLPYQFVSSWEHTIEEAIKLRPDHLSAYALTLESGTAMEEDVRQGRLPDPDPDLAAEMYLMGQALLTSAGYEQYEISNWAMPGRASTHNLAYWLNNPYLGVGPGAHSHLVGDREETLGLGPHGVRFASMKPPRTYAERVLGWHAEGNIDANALRALPTADVCEETTEATAMAETMMMGLRLNAGVSDAEFTRRFGAGIADRFPNVVADCIGLGLLEWGDGNLRLVEEARLLGNEAFGRFVAAVTE
jgi:oxygen-independent coproporphyrinogen-3 oxidase